MFHGRNTAVPLCTHQSYCIVFIHHIACIIVRDVQPALSSDLDPRRRVWKRPRDASMDAENVVVDHRSKGEPIKHGVTPLPYLLPQVVSETILEMIKGQVQVQLGPSKIFAAKRL